MRAGFYERDVTPPVGIYLAGYPSRKSGSEGVMDPLYLRIVAMEDDAGERVVLVTADLLKFPKDMAWRLKAWAEGAVGLKSASLVINLSHTHCAPGLFHQECYAHWPVDIEYVKGLEQWIREGIQAALEDLKPARITFGIGEAHFGVCRRQADPELGGKVRLGVNEDGYYDPDLPVMAFYGEGAEQPKAVLYSYACHPTSRSGQMISADWPGVVSRGIKQALGNDVMTLFVQGAGGSVGPRKHERGSTPEEYDAYWLAEGKKIAEFATSDRMQDTDLRLSAVEKEFEIPYDTSKMLSQEELLDLCDPSRETIPPALRPANPSIVRLWARGIYEKVRTGTLPGTFGMHIAKIGLNEGFQIIAMSGEVTADVGRMVKDLFPEKQTIFFGYCSYTGAYIPAAYMLEEGGHEALASIYFQMRPAPFVPEIDEIIKGEVRSL
ncbi:MAG: hypothetical protein GXP25_04750 [Planctomycetes bacterium]|nr:hypothetical protein [Planctomycetota bacterium]